MTRTLAQLAVSAARRQNTQAFAEAMREHLSDVIESGAHTDREIAARFNAKRLMTRSNQRWTPKAVNYLRGRLGVSKASAKTSKI